MSHAERAALQRLVDSVRKQLPRPTQQPGDDQEIAQHDQAQRATRAGAHESADHR